MLFLAFPRCHPGQPTGTFGSCLCLAWAVAPQNIQVSSASHMSASGDRPRMPFAFGWCCSYKPDPGNGYRRFRKGVCEASVGNLRASSRHRAPLSEPAGRVQARMAANQRPEIPRKRSATPVRNVGIGLYRRPICAASSRKVQKLFPPDSLTGKGKTTMME